MRETVKKRVRETDKMERERDRERELGAGNFEAGKENSRMTRRCDQLAGGLRDIDVWEGAPGTSADATRFGLKTIWSQMREKNLVKKFKILLDFTQFYLYFTHLMSLKSCFREERVKNSNLGRFFIKKNSKKSQIKFGLAFDSSLKVICEAPGKKSPIHLC